MKKEMRIGTWVFLVTAVIGLSAALQGCDAKGPGAPATEMGKPASEPGPTAAAAPNGSSGTVVTAQNPMPTSGGVVDAGTHATTSVVRGTVRLEGEVPPSKNVVIAGRDAAVCGKSIPDETLIVAANKGIQNAVVTLPDLKGAPMSPPRTVKVDQSGCRYVPHVQLAGVGGKLEILNSDPVMHNVHGYLGSATVFNVAMPLKNQQIPKDLAKPGVVKLRCDVHSWMNGYVVAVDTPYTALTDANGAFAIQGVPPGTHRILVWHERLGEKTATVEVAAASEAAIDVGMPLR